MLFVIFGECFLCYVDFCYDYGCYNLVWFDSGMVILIVCVWVVIRCGGLVVRSVVCCK